MNAIEHVTESAGEAWDRVRRRLRVEIGEEIYGSWFPRLRLEGVTGGCVRLSVPTRFLRSWIQQHYADRLGALWREEAGVERIDLTVRTAAFRSPTAMPAAALTITAPVPLDRAPPLAPICVPDPNGSPLTPGLTFDSFVAGQGNALSLAAMRKAAAEEARFSPLLLHSGPGLGKTHLLQAAAREAGQGAALYLGAEHFMSLAAGGGAFKASALREVACGVGLLLIDDIHRITGKGAYREFAAIVELRLSAGKPLILAAAMPPSEIEHLDRHLRSRLAGGLVAEIDPMDAALRRDLVAARIAAIAADVPGFVVPARIVDAIAGRGGLNGRDIGGALNWLRAQFELTGAVPSLEQADVILRGFLRSVFGGHQRLRIDDIMRAVARHYRVSLPDLLSQRRTADLLWPRHVAMYLAKELTMRSLPEIGRRCGGRDHTTVLSGVRKVARLVEADPDRRDEVMALKRAIGGEA
ncbi:DnaA/Hda family protein [Ancylobacter sp. MQZ15Z-1]|uniref:Chromosomal replication initiator protein DnaA n=1 Tax=Ancylobacter mangrovi TaxID=2972472 RepID=A0A9X2T624_9HYPH|nr:DnaA/Hda family protein [Ancylobacter mangrovi]MCS0497886.1 DnaA/Hda family protein [Ancylobacter mangrovi]